MYMHMHMDVAHFQQAVCGVTVTHCDDVALKCRVQSCCCARQLAYPILHWFTGPPYCGSSTASSEMLAGPKLGVQ